MCRISWWNCNRLRRCRLYYLRRGRLRLALIVIILRAALSILTAFHQGTRPFFVKPDEHAADSLSCIADVYKRVAPSVVGVESLRDDGAGSVVLGSGSGVIIDSDGYIVTNYHVVAEAANISVNLMDGRSGNAVLIAGDAGLDLALLETDLTD
ncbi:MAG: trypsin-like peptidase domain-containing protein, partial [Firmicutes bacterium]|nr:trypsin-like peptidase domain-containing protein [Bacillota bacterium]